MFCRRIYYRVNQKGCVGPAAKTTGAYPIFCTFRQQEYVNCPLDGMLMHCRISTSIKLICQYPFIHLGGEKHCEPGIQGSNPVQGLYLDCCSTIRSLHLLER